MPACSRIDEGQSDRLQPRFDWYPDRGFEAGDGIVAVDEAPSSSIVFLRIDERRPTFGSEGADEGQGCQATKSLHLKSFLPSAKWDRQRDEKAARPLQTIDTASQSKYPTKRGLWSKSLVKHKNLRFGLDDAFGNPIGVHRAWSAIDIRCVPPVKASDSIDVINVAEPAPGHHSVPIVSTFLTEQRVVMRCVIISTTPGNEIVEGTQMLQF